MAIPITYLPSTLAQGISDVSEEERASLRAARANAKKPLDFDLDGAFVALSDKGFDSRTSLDLIAKKLSEKANFDLSGARKAGFTNEQVVAKLIGRDPDDLEEAPVGSLFGGVGRGAVEGLPSGLALAGTALGLTAAGVASPLVIGGSFLAAIATGMTGAGQALEEALLGERQLLPGERGLAATGEVIGSFLSFSPGTQIALKSIPEAVDFGAKKLLAQHNEQKRKLAEEAGKLFTKDGVPKNVKRREFLENLVSSVGKEARDKSAISFGLRELAFGAIPAAAEGISESLYPGDDVRRTIAGVAASLVPNPTFLAADAVTSVGGVARQDISEKGFKGSAKNLFGALDRGDRARKQAAAEYIVRAYNTSQAAAARAAGQAEPENAALAFADELDRLVADDPEFANLLTPGQLTNDPFFLLMEASTRRGNVPLTNQQRDFGIQSRQHLRKLIKMLRLTGSDDLLKEAAKLEKEGLEAEITGLLDVELTKAAEAADKLALVRGDTDTTAKIKLDQGTLLKNAAERAVEQSKEVRRKLYADVDKNVQVSTAPLLAAYREIRASNLLTEAGELKGDLINDLRNYGLQTDTGLGDLLKEAASKKKTLTNRLDTVGRSFQKTAEGNPDAFNTFDLLVDTSGGAAKRGYENRLDQVIAGFSKKIDDPDAAGTEMSAPVRANILKLAKQAKEIESIKRNLTQATSEIDNVSLGDFASDDPVMMPIGELLAFRNKVRDGFRDAKRGIKDGPNEAQLAILDRGVTDAIKKRIDDGTIDGEMSDNIKALDLAERYAAAHQNVFRRTFVGELGRTRQVGDELIAPEQALDKLFAGRPTKNVKEILEAFGFRGLEGAELAFDEDFLGTASGAIDAYLRNEIAGKAKTTTIVNPITGKTETVQTLDQKDIDQFLNKNSEALMALDPSGSLLNDLQSAGTSKIALESVLNTQTERYKTHQAEVNLGKFLEVDSTEAVVADIISGKTAVTDLKTIARRINNAPINEVQKQSHKKALFSTLVDAALTKSLDNVGDKQVINFSKMYDILYDTSNKRTQVGLIDYPKEGPSLMQILDDAGGVPKEQAEELKTFLLRGKKLTEALDAGVDDFLAAKDTPAAKDFIARFAGAQGVSEATKMLGMTPTIQTTSAGAQLIRNQFINLPNMVAKDLLIDISKPGGAGTTSSAKTLADLMRAGSTPKQQNDIFVRIAKNIVGSPSYLTSLSVRGAQAAQEEQPTLEPVPVEQPVAMDAPLPPPMQQPIQPMPQQMAAPQPAPPPQGGVNPQQRQQFAALFPNDPISGLIQQQGIASLPQAPQ